VVGRPVSNNGAGRDAPEAILVALERIRLRVRREVQWSRRMWSNQPANPGGTAAAIDLTLADEPSLLRDEFFGSDPELSSLGPRVTAADHAFDCDETWTRLRREFALNAAELDLVAATVAAEVDTGLLTAYGYLQDSSEPRGPSLALCAALFDWPSASVVRPDGPLAYWQLAARSDPASSWSSLDQWLAAPPLLVWLLEEEAFDPALGMAARPVDVRAATGMRCLYPDVVAAVLEFCGAVWARGAGQPTAVEIDLVAPHGFGKRTLAAQACGKLGTNLLVVDVPLVLSADKTFTSGVAAAQAAIRLARLCGSAIYWHEPVAADPRLWSAISLHSLLSFFGSEAAFSRRTDERPQPARRLIELPRLTRSERLALWSGFSADPPPSQVVDWVLSAGDVAAVAMASRAGPAAVADACRRTLHRGHEELVSPMPRPYSWDDIVLPPAVSAHLREFETQAKLRSVVYDDWGFGGLCPTGQGVTAMFAGPSGTGKTMAAQVVAADLGMDLYRVDLAGVVNKYIGETEKRLKQVFDACERANVVILFDEADALFGQRTQVKDAHDRFANIEIDYLLQRMERFEGIAILATNRKGDMDRAFVRRLRFIIDFPQPGPVERMRLWEIALPERSPRGERLLGTIDLTPLANRFPLTGAEIKAAALAAAFRARAEGSLIEMPHLLASVRRELTKRGLEMSREAAG
jgi:ATPase family protein associated with various cellular activities (AAA)